MAERDANNRENKSAHPSGAQGAQYEIRVLGHLDECWSNWLEGLEAERLENGEMIIFGQVKDQAALMGILNKLYCLNLTLLSVNQLKRTKSRQANFQRGDLRNG